MTRRDEYIDKMKKQLDELNAKMSRVEAGAKEARDEARQKYKDEMVKLRHQSTIAATKLDELKAASEDSWEAMASEMEKVRDALVHSFSYFKSQL
jgi:chromosome segregation ATPase